jgi:hypothetical protein
MTKLIAALIIAVVLYGGWQLFFYWERVQHEQENQKKEAATEAVRGDQMPGLPWELDKSLQTAQGLGATGLRNWLKAYGDKVQDPRKAWIQLDYCLMVSAEDPSEARRVFAEVKKRTPPTSPVWPRIQRLEKTYE